MDSTKRDKTLNINIYKVCFSIFGGKNLKVSFTNMFSLVEIYISRIDL